MAGFLVEYTIHDDDDDFIRNIVENTLEENDFYICEGTTLYYKEDEYNIIITGILKKHNLDNICSNKKSELLKSVRKQLSNRGVSIKYIMDIMKLIELQVFAVVGGSGY